MKITVIGYHYFAHTLLQRIKDGITVASKLTVIRAVSSEISVWHNAIRLQM